MPDLRPGAQKLLSYFGVIASSVAERASTHELWEAIRSEAARRGEQLSGVGAIDVGQLRGIAAGLRNGRQALSTADRNLPLPRGAVAQNIYSRPEAQQSLAPAYHVRFNVGVRGPTGLQQKTMTWVMTGALPNTWGELADSVEAFAMALAEQGDSELEAGFLESVGDYEISAV